MKPWYKSEALAILALIICPPVGVVLAWLQRWDPIVKTVASLFSLSGSIVLLLVLANMSSPNELAGGAPSAAAAQAAAQSKPVGAPAVGPPAQASAAGAQAVPQPVVSNPQDSEDMNPKNVFSRAFSGLGGALKGFLGDVTRPPTAPPSPGANPAQASPVIRAQTGASQSGQPAPAASGPAPGQPSAQAGTAASPVAPVPAVPGAPVAAAPATGPQALTAAQKKDVQDALSASIAHYARLIDAGKAALGTKKYADAAEAAAAIDQPGSPAAKFSEWRETSGVDDDTTFEEAYDKATTVYGAAGNDIPAGLDEWLTQMTDVQSALVDWADAAIDWQGQDKTDAELADAEKSVRDGLNKARAAAQSL